MRLQLLCQNDPSRREPISKFRSTKPAIALCLIVGGRLGAQAPNCSLFLQHRTGTPFATNAHPKTFPSFGGRTCPDESGSTRRRSGGVYPAVEAKSQSWRQRPVIRPQATRL